MKTIMQRYTKFLTLCDAPGLCRLSHLEILCYMTCLFVCLIPRLPEGQEAAASTETGPSSSSQPEASDGEQQEGRGAPKRDKGAKEEEDDKDTEGEPSSSTAREGEGEAEPGEGGEAGATESVLTEDDLIQQSQAEYDSGRYSPTLLQSSELPLDAHVVEIDEDLHRLHLARRQLQVTGGYTYYWVIHSSCQQYWVIHPSYCKCIRVLC